MGLIEYNWLTTINTLKKENYHYIDFVLKAKEMVKFFHDNGCDFIIALTHMRTNNDK
jgi:5'-nucleotidase